MSLLEIENLSSGYGKTAVLHGVELRVEDKEIVTIIGPNGAGKTTLMKTIAGLVKPNGGRICFHKKEITGLEPDAIVRKGIGYVPQEYNIFPSLTVIENLKVGAYLMKNFSHKLNDVFSLFPILKDRKNQKAGTLSGGERQMLAIATSLMLDPNLLLLDEPCGGLAPKIMSEVCKKIKEINASGTAIVWVVEQNPKRVMSFASRCYILESGVIKYEGAPEVLLKEKKFESFLFSEG